MLEFPSIGGSTLAARLDLSLSATPLLLCSSGLCHNLLRLSRCPRPTSSISYRVRIFRAAFILTSCWAASYFTIFLYQVSPAYFEEFTLTPHSPQPKLTASLFPGLLFQPTYGTLLAHEDSFYQECLEVSASNGVHTGQGENVRITLQPSDLLSPSRSASNKTTGSTLSAVRQVCVWS